MTPEGIITGMPETVALDGLHFNFYVYGQDMIGR
jgi:hypothetical protein